MKCNSAKKGGFKISNHKKKSNSITNDNQYKQKNIDCHKYIIFALNILLNNEKKKK